MKRVVTVGTDRLLERMRLSGGLISAMDGLWFLTVEKALGNAEAIKLDKKVWQKYIHVYVKRTRKTFALSGSGIDCLKQLIELDPLFSVNDYEISRLSDNGMFIRVNVCSTLMAMEKAARTKPVCETTTGIYFRNMAREVDPGITVHAMKLPPRRSPDEACCEWLFEK